MAAAAAEGSIGFPPVRYRSDCGTAFL